MEQEGGEEAGPATHWGLHTGSRLLGVRVRTCVWFKPLVIGEGSWAFILTNTLISYPGCPQTSARQEQATVRGGPFTFISMFSLPHVELPGEAVPRQQALEAPA